MTAAPARAYDGDTSTILMTASAAGYSTPRRSAVKTQSPRHDPLFRLWFAADTSQLAARVLTSVALPLLAIAVTTSSSAASLVVAASAAGTSMALLPGGMMADRLKRDRLIGTLACLTAVAYCLIAGFESLRSSVSLVWLLGFVFCAAVFQIHGNPRVLRDAQIAGTGRPICRCGKSLGGTVSCPWPGNSRGRWRSLHVGKLGTLPGRGARGALGGLLLPTAPTTKYHRCGESSS